MGQKIHPLGFRLGITKKHKSQWFAKKNKYPQFVVEDYFLRKIINEKFYNAGIENILIQRKLDQIKIEICVARAGILIGKHKKNLQLLRKLLEQKLQKYRLQNFNVLNVSNFANFKLHSKLAISEIFFSNNSQLLFQTPNLNQTPGVNKKLQIPVNINSPKISIHIIKLTDPNTKANFIADFLVDRLEKRASFRQAIKTAIRRCQKSKVKGIKIQISGRLNGAEIARTEWVREGRVPLQTLRADIDYSYKTAKTIYGILGVKVWLFNGELNSNY